VPQIWEASTFPWPPTPPMMTCCRIFPDHPETASFRIADAGQISAQTPQPVQMASSTGLARVTGPSKPRATEDRRAEADCTRTARQAALLQHSTSVELTLSPAPHKGALLSQDEYLHPLIFPEKPQDRLRGPFHVKGVRHLHPGASTSQIAWRSSTWASPLWRCGPFPDGAGSRSWPWRCCPAGGAGNQPHYNGRSQGPAWRHG